MKKKDNQNPTAAEDQATETVNAAESVTEEAQQAAENQGEATIEQWQAALETAVVKSFCEISEEI